MGRAETFNAVTVLQTILWSRIAKDLEATIYETKKNSLWTLQIGFSKKERV